jgi:exopolysaccharide biosynthesis polyprenyl glycosylphosphotransferase
VIVGSGGVGSFVATALAAHPDCGLQPIGFLDSRPDPAAPYPVLGRPEQLVGVLEEYDVSKVIIAYGSMPEARLIDVIRTADRLDCEIFVVPRLLELQHAGPDVDTVWGIPLVRLRRAAHRTVGWQVKRGVDVLVAALALPLLSPLLVLLAVAVRMETGPGVLFRQERVGVDGTRFRLYKFRSITPTSEAESATTWSVRGDARMGPVGRFVRRTSLDELPQLLNVLRREMSLVGPRPERPHFVDAFHDRHQHYPARHRVPCGLTGLAQVNGLRGDTSIAERARFDNYYIENWSLWLDAKILLRTAVSVLRAEGS